MGQLAFWPISFCTDLSSSHINLGGRILDSGLEKWRPDIAATSARIKFDDEQFVEIFNELQARGDKTKLMQLFGH